MGKKYRDLVRAHATAKRSNRTVLNILADYADDDGEAWPGYETLAQEAGLSERTIMRCISSLIEDGDLEYVDGGLGKGNKQRFRILIKGVNLSPYYENQKVTNTNEKVTTVHEKVTSTHAKGDNGDNDTIYRTVIEPYIEPRENRAREDHPVEPAEPPTPPTLSQTDVDEFVNATNVTANALPPVPTPPFQPVLTDSPTGPPQARQFDPRQLDSGGLWPEGTGQTPYEVYREAFATIPSRYQIKHMNANVTDLDKWRQVTQRCALKSFKTYDNVFDVYLNGFRNEVQSGANEPGRANQANPPRPPQIERRALGQPPAISRKRAAELFEGLPLL